MYLIKLTNRKLFDVKKWSYCFRALIVRGVQGMLHDKNKEFSTVVRIYFDKTLSLKKPVIFKVFFRISLEKSLHSQKSSTITENFSIPLKKSQLPAPCH